jgi:hypothetical protein
MSAGLIGSRNHWRPHAPVGYLKLFLGCVRIVAAAKTIASHRWGEPNVAAGDRGTGPTFILR